MAAVNRESDKFVLRLPDGLRDRIKRAAESNRRSMNAEIVATLESYYPPEPSAADLIQEIDMAISWAQANHMPWARADGRNTLMHKLQELRGVLAEEAAPNPGKRQIDVD
jgi:hypothetical protein